MFTLQLYVAKKLAVFISFQSALLYGAWCVCVCLWCDITSVFVVSISLFRLYVENKSTLLTISTELIVATSKLCLFHVL